MAINILIVDDHPGIQLLLFEVFTHQGYNVTRASTGIEALQLIEDNGFEVAVLDNNLPLLSGIELVEILLEKEIELKVILISGMTDGLIEKTENCPLVKKVLGKPFNISDLCDIVKEVIEQ